MPFDRTDSSQSGTASEAPQMASFLRQLWRRRWLLAGTILTLTFIAAAVLVQVTPRYTATAVLMIEVRENNVLDLEAVVAGLPNDAATVESEIQVLRSRGLARKVVDQLQLDFNPEFNSALQPAAWYVPWFERGRTLIGSIFGVDRPPQGPTPSSQELYEKERIQVVDNFMGNLKVNSIGRSRAIRISFTAESPETAAEVANTLADLYIVEQLEGKFEATKRVTVWLNSRVSALRSDVETKENAVEAFRKKYNLLRGEGGEALIAQELSQLSTQLTDARADRARVEAQLRQIRTLAASGNVESADAVLQSELIRRLREQESEVIRMVSDMASQYQETHPRMINIRSQLSDIQTTIQTEIQKIARGLENEVAVARSRESNLGANLNALKNRVADSNSAEVQLRSLEQEALASRNLLETFLARFISTSAQQDIASQTPDARIVSRADVPDDPSFPKKKLILMLVFMSSGALGIALVFVLDALDNSFRSSEEVEAATGVNVLGLVPMLKSWRGKSDGLHNYVIKKPASAVTESIRTLHTSILLSHVDEPPKKILITSSQPGEGKTSLAVGLGRLQAITGRKVLIIDADVRRPKVHKLLGLNGKPGLVELLIGDASIEEVLQKDEASGADVITTETFASNPPDLFGSKRMAQLLDNLAESYDLVILDSPPVSAVSDARILAGLSDTTVFVVRWGGARREVVTRALRQIAETGGHLAGVVVSMVNVKKHARYGYGDSGQYSGAVRKYYVG